LTRPDFDDLVGDDTPADERARLKRAHDLLVAAGPPPELTPALESPPETLSSYSWLPRRRRGTALLLAATLVVAAFAMGFLIGDRSEDSTATAGFEADQTVVLGESGSTVAVVRLGRPDENGNHPMLVTVEGLEHQTSGDYYSLFMLKKGRRALCGTFNVAGGESTTVRLTIGYDPDDYDGLMLAEYKASDHKNHPLLRAPL
jgi:hypothetical protein